MSTHYSASHSFTLRAKLDDRPGSFADLARAIADAGGLLDAIDLVRVDAGMKIRDISVFATDAEHADRIVAACADVPGVEVERVSDRAFLMHLGGKIESAATLRSGRATTCPWCTRRVSRGSAARSPRTPSTRLDLTIRANTVAIVTDGSAVLGLGNIGPAAAMPVMEGKSLLFKEFAGIDAFPLCLDTQHADEIVAPSSGDRAGLRRDQPRGHRCAECFEIEERCGACSTSRCSTTTSTAPRSWSSPPFATRSRVVGKRIEDVAIVVTARAPPGSPGPAAASTAGVRDIVLCDRAGVLHRGRTADSASRPWFAEQARPRCAAARPTRSAARDVFIGLSGPRALTRGVARRMAEDALSSRWRIPIPDRSPEEMRASVAVIATGPQRLPEPDQQRARLPRGVPRPPGRSRADDHRFDGGRRGPRYRRRRSERTSSPPTTSFPASSNRDAGARGRECGRPCGGGGRRARA